MQEPINSRDLFISTFLFHLANWIHGVSPPRGLQSIMLQPPSIVYLRFVVHFLHQHHCCHVATPLLVAVAPSANVNLASFGLHKLYSHTYKYYLTL